MKVTVIGSNGFVGSAFARLFEALPDVELVRVTRDKFDSLAGPSDVVINAACNARKFFADEHPVLDIDATVGHTLRALLAYPAGLFIQISTVDVYSRISSQHTTREDCAVDISATCRYGAHKLLAEQLVKLYAPRWLILRCGGMVGPGVKKGPVFDILNELPLRIHPNSQYQYLSTDAMAAIAWKLFCKGYKQEVFNVCGTGTVTMHEVAALAGKTFSDEHPPLSTRIVNVNNDKLRSVMPVPETRETITRFISAL